VFLKPQLNHHQNVMIFPLSAHMQSAITALLFIVSSGRAYLGGSAMRHVHHRSLFHLGLGSLALVASLALFSGCGTPAASNTSSANTLASPTVSAMPLAEHLTFQGDITGVLTEGLFPHPLTHNHPVPDYVQEPDGTLFDPAPSLTQCADVSANDITLEPDYLAVIVGNVGTKRFAITIEMNEDDPAYTKPGTQLLPGDTNSGGSVEVYEMGGQNRRWQQVYEPALQDTVIVLNASRVSGTVDAWMASTDQSQKGAASTLHMQGNWRCG
jgi:hypothetical protein